MTKEEMQEYGLALSQVGLLESTTGILASYVPRSLLIRSMARDAELMKSSLRNGEIAILVKDIERYDETFTKFVKRLTLGENERYMWLTYTLHLSLKLLKGCANNLERGL